MIREQSNERMWIPYKRNCKKTQNANNTILEGGNLMSQVVIIVRREEREFCPVMGESD